MMKYQNQRLNYNNIKHFQRYHNNTREIFGDQIKNKENDLNLNIIYIK